jgi:transposase
MRAGADYFIRPAGPSQRRYEALRAYFVDGMPASEVADRFGYSTASVHQMATLLRTGKLSLFTDPRPGPRGPRKATGQLRARVLALRAAGHSVTEIAAALTEQGMPVSPQTTWQILDAEGIPRLPRRDEGRRGPPARLEPVKAAKLPGWPAASASLPCDHAGLLLLFPGMADLQLPALVRAAGYPSTRQLTAWQSVGSLILAKCARKARVHHVGSLTDDAGLAFTLGLTALPKATHLGSYSWRVRRESNVRLLSGLVGGLRLGLATGQDGFNCDFHAIRHHGADAQLEKHYVPRRSQRTRAVLTFFAQDHASFEMVYANADLTKAEQAAEILAQADGWDRGQLGPPGCLADRVDARQQSELAEHEQIVAGRGVPGDLAVADPVNVDLVSFEGPSAGRHSIQDAAGPDARRELAQVRAARHHPVHHRVAAGDFLLDLDVQVGKRRAPRRDDVPQRGLAARSPDAEVGEVVVNQLLDGRQLPVVPHQVPEAADDCGVVQLGGHGLLLSAPGAARAGAADGCAAATVVIMGSGMFVSPCHAPSQGYLRLPADSGAAASGFLTFARVYRCSVRHGDRPRSRGVSTLYAGCRSPAMPAR